MSLRGGRGETLVVLAIAVVWFSVVVTGCSQQLTTSRTAAAPAKVQVPDPAVHVVPGHTAHGIAPSERVTVRVQFGTLTSVEVTPAQQTTKAAQQTSNTLAGRLTQEGQRWQSRGLLDLATRYTVTASVRDSRGHMSQHTSTFSTLTPRRRVQAHVSPLEGETVGVGMPIAVYFTEPVRNRAAVERRLHVEASRNVRGSWYWISNEEAHFRPRHYWPANTNVTLHTRLRGVDAGAGVWGDRNRAIGFRIGDAFIARVNVDRHHMTVSRNGKLLRTIPISSGKPGFLTRNGKKVVLAKERVNIMDAASIGISPGDPEYYRLRVEYAVRVTWSGEFLHSAPWSVGSQGLENVSHGCVGMSPSNAAWYYDLAKRGDVVEVSGSPRPMELTNGFGDWNLTWDRWQRGSALP